MANLLRDAKYSQWRAEIDSWPLGLEECQSKDAYLIQDHTKDSYQTMKSIHS